MRPYRYSCSTTLGLLYQCKRPPTVWSVGFGVRTVVLLADVVFLRTVKRGLRLASIDLHRDFARFDAFGLWDFQAQNAMFQIRRHRNRFHQCWQGYRAREMTQCADCHHRSRFSIVLRYLLMALWYNFAERCAYMECPNAVRCPRPPFTPA